MFVCCKWMNVHHTEQRCVCVKALQSLGCSHVLEAYLQALSVEGFASVDSVREIQYEAACRNSKWDLELATRYYCCHCSGVIYLSFCICILHLIFVYYFRCCCCYLLTFPGFG